ncbi:hypothetical protein C8R45DRAFT_545381 [Mycena sanguinolenta]|nr:hypothetical protein C8R45DRAFT_545381 [Mycena sanguinolenta]
MASESDPRLPPELERRICEIAAVACPIRIPTLMLVARRVRFWVEPLLYRVVFLKDSTTGQLLRDLNLPAFTADALEQRPPNSFRHVRHLFIDDDVVKRPTLKSWLLACTGVTNLYAWFNCAPDILPSINSLTDLQYHDRRPCALRRHHPVSPVPQHHTSRAFRLHRGRRRKRRSHMAQHFPYPTAHAPCIESSAIRSLARCALRSCAITMHCVFVSAAVLGWKSPVR